MRVLVFAHMYPVPQHPEFGIFVQQQVESLRREGVEVDVLHVNVKESRLNYFWSFVPFLRHALARRYDLVHAHYVFAGIVARSQFRYPLVVTHHGDEAFYGWQTPLCRVTSRLADKSIVVTEQIKNSIGPDDVAVIPCGVDFDVFRPKSKAQARAQLSLTPDRELVLFVGNYPERRKRFDLVQGAVERLRAGGHNVDLVVAYKQPYEKIPLYMNACDVLVLPSEREGSPQVVKEAMACDLPVVATEVGDVPEVLAGVEGCHLCRHDPSDIAEKLAMVLDRGGRTDGRERTRRFELGAVARRIIDVYQEVLDRKRHRQ